MKRVLVVVVCLAMLAAANPVFAQGPAASDKKKLKFWGGVGLLAAGGLMLATSRRSGGDIPIGGGETFHDPGNMQWGQFLTGGVLAGLGGYLVWDTKRKKPTPQTKVGFTFGKQRTAGIITRSW